MKTKLQIPSISSYLTERHLEDADHQSAPALPVVAFGYANQSLVLLHMHNKAAMVAALIHEIPYIGHYLHSCVVQRIVHQSATLLSVVAFGDTNQSFVLLHMGNSLMSSDWNINS